MMIMMMMQSILALLLESREQDRLPIKLEKSFGFVLLLLGRLQCDLHNYDNNEDFRGKIDRMLRLYFYYYNRQLPVGFQRNRYLRTR